MLPRTLTTRATAGAITFWSASIATLPTLIERLSFTRRNTLRKMFVRHRLMCEYKPDAQARVMLRPLACAAGLYFHQPRLGVRGAAAICGTRLPEAYDCATRYYDLPRVRRAAGRILPRTFSCPDLFNKPYCWYSVRWIYTTLYAISTKMAKPHRKLKKANHGARPANAKARKAKRRKIRT